MADCVILNANRGCHHLVAIAESIKSAMHTISVESQKPYADVGTYRVPPLVLSRLGRGGKTTMLHLLFDELKGSGSFLPIYISFNAGFQRLPDEKDADAILRLIAVQFIDLPAETKNPLSYNFRFTSEAVLQHISASSADGRTVVLLIDELNSLRRPLDRSGADLLRTEFLDKTGRYLVFSTHLPMNLDSTVDELNGTVSNPSSIRRFVNLSMPFSNDVTVMRAMFAGQSLSIVPTPAQVALYGGIPSLLYCSLATGDEITIPKFRSEYEIEREPIKSEVKMPLFIDFVQEVLTGIREHETVRRFDMFSSIDASRKSSWPLCFISPILVAISREMGLKMLSDIANKIADLVDRDLSALTARTHQTGLDWEVIVQIAILLRCIGRPGANIVLPFLGDCKVSGTICVTIPAEYQSLDQAHSFISKCVRSLATDTVAYITPQFAKFPDYDGFLVYKEAVVGIQIKLTRGYPKHPVPDWISEAFLIRGNAPATTYVDEKWTYLNKEEMVALLGYSLAPLYPNTWPEQPLSDDFL